MPAAGRRGALTRYRSRHPSISSCSSCRPRAPPRARRSRPVLACSSTCLSPGVNDGGGQWLRLRFGPSYSQPIFSHLRLPSFVCCHLSRVKRRKAPLNLSRRGEVLADHQFTAASECNIPRTFTVTTARGGGVNPSLVECGDDFCDAPVNLNHFRAEPKYDSVAVSTHHFAVALSAIMMLRHPSM